MTEFNKHGEHDNDMDYIIDLQAEIVTLKESEAKYFAKAKHFEELNRLSSLEATSSLKIIENRCNEHDTLKAKAELLEAAADALKEIKIIACKSNYLDYEGTAKLYNLALDAHNAILSEAKAIK